MNEPRPNLKKVARTYESATGRFGNARKQLYRAIRTEAANGQSYRSIAAQTGLSFQRVAQIVKREEES